MKPNLLIFMPETLRADFIFGEKGLKAYTPNMDRLACEGAYFTGCFSTSPFCTPSRCSMFTGLYPHVNGHRSLMHLLHEYERNLFMDLRDAGYETVCFGKNDLVAGKAIEYSFDETKLRVKPQPTNWEMPVYEKSDKHYHSFYIGRRDESAAHDSDWACIQSALNFIREKHMKPFCIFLPLSFAHPPYMVEEPFFSMHKREDVKKPVPQEYGRKTRVHRLYQDTLKMEKLDEEDLVEIRATYQGMIARTDFQLGMLLDELDKCGLSETTAVLVFSDHGDYAGDYGQVEKINYNFEDCLLNIPVIARVPGHIGGVKRKCFIEGIDIYPTILELAGIKPQHQHFGKSFVGLLDGTAIDIHRRFVFAEAGFSADEIQSYTPLDHVKGGEYEEICRCLLDNKGLPGRRVMIRTSDWKYVYSPEGHEELYNLKCDCQEKFNLTEEEYNGVKFELRNRILKWMILTSDTVPYKHDERSFG